MWQIVSAIVGVVRLVRGADKRQSHPAFLSKLIEVTVPSVRGFAIEYCERRAGKSRTTPPTSAASRKRPFVREGRRRGSEWDGGGNSRRRDPASSPAQEAQGRETAMAIVDVVWSVRAGHSRGRSGSAFAPLVVSGPKPGKRYLGADLSTGKILQAPSVEMCPRIPE